MRLVKWEPIVGDGVALDRYLGRLFVLRRCVLLHRQVRQPLGNDEDDVAQVTGFAYTVFQPGLFLRSGLFIFGVNERRNNRWQMA